jgi:hypothetical protein
MSNLFKLPLIQALISFCGFFALVLWRSEQPLSAPRQAPHDRVVISAPVLTVLYGGDRFLAADLETIRLSATGIDRGQADTHYLIRAHKVVSELNPCHENNYYLGNALLTWGGAVEEGGEILQRAAECRFWDELPPFLYGFNQFFFNKEIEKAQQYLEIAASRSERNAAGFRKLAIMIEAEQIDDEKMALDFLRQEYNKAENTNLKVMLDKRVKRLEGLVLLRDAQRIYEQQTGKALQHPNELLDKGIIDQFPNDPTRLGYEFDEGRFKLKKAKIAGVEER